MPEPRVKFGADDVGLCATCRHARVLETPRSMFWRCLLAAHDARFDKYPRLPVLHCIGYERVPPAESET
jgi:hypothetical protein